MSAGAGAAAAGVQCIVVADAPALPAVGLLVGATLALIIPAACLALGLDPNWLPGAGEAWRAAHFSADRGLAEGPFVGVLLTQTIIFVFANLIWLALVRLTPQTGWFLPRWRARTQAHGLHGSADSVLLYVALRQREACIVVGASAARRIAPAALTTALDRLTRAARAGQPDRGMREARAALGLEA